VANVVLAGRAGMPAFMGDLTTREIAAILTFIRAGWENNASPVPVEQVEQFQQQILDQREQEAPGSTEGSGSGIGH
jgi:mono/diheme cytochrome c family protein